MASISFLTCKKWGKQDTNGLVLVSLPQETNLILGISGDDRTLKLGIQQIGRSHFHTAHTSGSQNGEYSRRISHLEYTG